MSDTSLDAPVQSDLRITWYRTKPGPVLTFLYWRMNWHCEHHMYAAVPCYSLRRLARHIAHDMPLPETATPAPAAPGPSGTTRPQGIPGPGGGPEASDDKLSSAIGDLAPKGME